MRCLLLTAIVLWPWIAMGQVSAASPRVDGSQLAPASFPTGVSVVKTFNFSGSGNSANNAGFYGVLTADGACSDPVTCYLNSFISTDDVDASSASNGSFSYLFKSVTRPGASGGKGPKGTALFWNTIIETPSQSGMMYAALGTLINTLVDMNGGSIFGFNPQTRHSVGTINQLVGVEIDASIDAGASAVDFILQQNVITADHSVSASLQNIGFAESKQASASPGLDALYQDGAYAGYPAIASTGSVFRCMPHQNNGTCPSITSGIDLSKYASVTGKILYGPQANGYIDGNFNFSGGSVSATSFSAGGQPGLSTTTSALAKSGGGSCTLTFTNGLLTASTC